MPDSAQGWPKMRLFTAAVSTLARAPRGGTCRPLYVACQVPGSTTGFAPKASVARFTHENLVLWVGHTMNAVSLWRSLYGRFLVVPCHLVHPSL